MNISTQNVLAERNDFANGHGVSIGSETSGVYLPCTPCTSPTISPTISEPSGWVRDVLIRDSVLHGTNLAVRIKSMRGRGGGVEAVVYENLTGVVRSSIQLTLNYHSAGPTNVTATPVLRNVTLRDLRCAPPLHLPRAT